MSITIELPDELLEQARAEGVELTPQAIARLIEAEMTRARSVRYLREAMQKLDGTLTEAEVEAELAAAKRERIADQR